MIDLACFSREDYDLLLEVAVRFRALPSTGPRRIPALQGRFVTTLFFEPSTRTRSSFEIAARRLSADVLSFSPAGSSLCKGESLLDTALTYVAMGADLLVVRHCCSGVPAALARDLAATGQGHVGVLNAGDGLHSHPSQALLDLLTLATHFCPQAPTTAALAGKRIAIVGDVVHSRVARSNLWSLTACGADVHLCGPPTLLPDCFVDFVRSPPPGIGVDPVARRGQVRLFRQLDAALEGVDAVVTLRLQRERMREQLITTPESYHRSYGISRARLDRCGPSVPVLHPGPVNRGVELSGDLLDDSRRCLVNVQVANGIPVRMALLYLLAAAGN